jgi:poly(A) polymerase
LLPTLSAERVAQEMLRLLGIAEPSRALEMMAKDGVLAVILPEARRLDRLRRLIAFEPEPDPLRRLAALVEVDAAGAKALAERLRFSNALRDRLAGLAPPWPVDPRAAANAQRRAIYRLRAARYRDLMLLRAAEEGGSSDHLKALLALATGWPRPNLPVTGDDVIALGVPPGPRVGALLAAVERWWKAADFAPDRAQSLAYLAEFAASAPARCNRDEPDCDGGKPRPG